ncbi:hypothetical protein GJ633_06165 [Halorubrum sp. CBA1125]|uniref:hypothetical protein n=1 Tax=Halorubrum sp. CBA1125 TaxID=2668072 RepID=UPI0012E98B26|nr:hypothetical protein [Halorubrum sp. CBA1125]MUW14291.1 hypothetical protein [Halorubrum sp. CBA1125]
MAGIIDQFNRYKNPEYTGNNRCLPCTIVNSGIGITVSAGAAGLATVSGWERAAAPIATVLIVISAVSIYFRGYLIPGTPALTRRYLPRELRTRFGKETSKPPISDDIDVERLLVSAGTLRENKDGTDLRLTQDFESRWKTAIETIRGTDVDRDHLLELLDLSADEVTFEEYPMAFRMRVDGRDVGKWESQEAFFADVAAAELLEDRVSNWSHLDAVQRGQLLNGLRLFLTRCPGCDGPLSLDMNTVESCCSSREVLVLSCDECNTRILESDQTDL